MSFVLLSIVFVTYPSFESQGADNLQKVHWGFQYFAWYADWFVCLQLLWFLQWGFAKAWLSFCYGWRQRISKKPRSKAAADLLLLLSCQINQQTFNQLVFRTACVLFQGGSSLSRHCIPARPTCKFYGFLKDFWDELNKSNSFLLTQIFVVIFKASQANGVCWVILWG